MDSIRDLGISDERKSHYSWRHFFATVIHKTQKLTPEQERFLCGHAAIDTHARVYLHHHMGDLTAAVEAMVDPTLECAA